ncbi:hypothetical protein GALL_461860 [mine drainage metagenome]|uniref:Uncharacterized protein n=1 Tax=mine drainage metagenome TaxID=410659 RepID=A0A1J5PKY0_9ZZZZ
MPQHRVTIGQAVALIERLRDSLKSINGAFDKPFDEDIAQADAFLRERGNEENDAQIAVIGPWGSERYGHKENPRGPDFEVCIIDRLARHGQVFIDVRPDGGNADDLLSTMVEVSGHPETGQPVPVVRVHRGENCIANIYADGMDKALLVVAKTDLQNGILRVKVG